MLSLARYPSNFWFLLEFLVLSLSLHPRWFVCLVATRKEAQEARDRGGLAASAQGPRSPPRVRHEG